MYMNQVVKILKRLLNIAVHVLHVCKYVSLVSFTSTVNLIADGKI